MLKFLHSEIGSSKDNMKSPVHNWYKFTAGFSYKFVEEIIALENLKNNKFSKIFDPFAGCGTTLVSCQKEEVSAVGNESQSFMFDIIKAKLNWKISSNTIDRFLSEILISIGKEEEKYQVDKIAHPLLVSLYDRQTLVRIYLIRDFLNSIKSEKYKLFFKLGLSQTLHKVANHPIAVPYISRNKNLKEKRDVIAVFQEICGKMVKDTKEISGKANTSKIYSHDSRKKNRFIKDDSCNLCITSPPYLNNLDYGEVSKVHTHFFEITQSWNDITNRVRKKLVTGATTHYKLADFNLENFLSDEFSIVNENLISRLIKDSDRIKASAKEKNGKKSFHVLMLFYFQDMYFVLKEIKRVLKSGSNAYLILGDSAPYGIHIPTTQILGEIGLNVGFKNYEIHKIRDRGNKWTTLKHRHKVKLTENVLILK